MCAAQKTLEGWNWESESYAVATNWAYMGATGGPTQAQLDAWDAMSDDITVEYRGYWVTVTGLQCIGHLGRPV